MPTTIDDRWNRAHHWPPTSERCLYFCARHCLARYAGPRDVAVSEAFAFLTASWMLELRDTLYSLARGYIYYLFQNASLSREFL